MSLFIMILLIVIYFVFSDLIPIYRQRNTSLLWVYITLMAFSLVLNILVLSRFKIPVISVSIKRFLELFIRFSY